MTDQTTPIHQSLHRHSHVFGAERELVLLSGLICFLVGVGGMTVISFLSAPLFWFVTLFFLRRMAKADPIMSKVWLKHIKQQDYYPARSKAWRRT